MRAYCRCTTVQNYTYEEAAAKLACRLRFLKDNISRLPHQKIGEAVAFCDCELRLIQNLFTVLPAAALELVEPPAPPGADTPHAPNPLAGLTPSQGRRRRQLAGA